MKCKSWAKISHLSLVGVEPAEVKGDAPEVFDLPPGITILHLRRINDETCSMMVRSWKRAELFGSLQLRRGR